MPGGQDTPPTARHPSRSCKVSQQVPKRDLSQICCYHSHTPGAGSQLVHAKHNFICYFAHGTQRSQANYPPDILQNSAQACLLVWMLLCKVGRQHLYRHLHEPHIPAVQAVHPQARAHLVQHCTCSMAVPIEVRSAGAIMTRSRAIASASPCSKTGIPFRADQSPHGKSSIHLFVLVMPLDLPPQV